MLCCSFHPTPSPSGRAGKSSPLAAAIVLLAFASLIVGLVLFLRLERGAGREALPALEYRENPNNYSGNEYRLSGQIHSLLLWKEGVGRLVAVRPDGNPGRLAVFVPDSLGLSLHTGHRYHLDLIVEEGGLLYVENLEKHE